MATVINNPGETGGGDSGAGLILGVILAIVLIALFFIFGLPAIRNNGGDENGTNINIETPPITVPIPGTPEPNPTPPGGNQ